jgi:hypothetical protein
LKDIPFGVTTLLRPYKPLIMWAPNDYCSLWKH